MAYAKVDENNYIIECAATKGIGYNAEFSNLDYVEEHCVDGLEDFMIIDGEAVYSPTVEKQTKTLKSDFNESDYIASKFIDLFIQCESLEEMLSCMKSYKEEYAEEFSKRNNWRNKINDLRKDN